MILIMYASSMTVTMKIKYNAIEIIFLVKAGNTSIFTYIYNNVVTKVCHVDNGLLLLHDLSMLDELY
jgi:hypothetical protein